MPSTSRVLIVDDHPRNIVILTKVLAGEHQLAVAASGEEALEVAASFEPDLVLLDIMMPGLDGFETCRRMRADPALAHTKIIMVSARAALSERLAGYAAGADDYIVKPFDTDELALKVRVFLRLKSVEEVDRLKTDILTLISHETRTPLTTILSPIDLLLDDEGLTEEQRDLLRMAQDGARRIHALVQKATFLSQLHAGAIRFEMRACDPAPLVQSAVEALLPAARAAGNGFVVDLAADLSVSCDAGLVQEAVGILLANAVQHGPRAGTVEVRLAAEGGGVRLAVRDHGAGIAPEFLPHLFAGFAVPDLRRHARGHGLSLATARAIVLRHGGRLTAANHAEGGAEFQLDLPLAGSREQADAPASVGAADR